MHRDFAAVGMEYWGISKSYRTVALAEVNWDCAPGSKLFGAVGIRMISDGTFTVVEDRGPGTGIW